MYEKVDVDIKKCLIININVKNTYGYNIQTKKHFRIYQNNI